MADSLRIDIDMSISKRSDGWWDAHYEAFIGPGPEGQRDVLASGNTQGGSRRVVIDSVSRHIREETKQRANEHFGDS